MSTLCRIRVESPPAESTLASLVTALGNDKYEAWTNDKDPAHVVIKYGGGGEGDSEETYRETADAFQRIVIVVGKMKWRPTTLLTSPWIAEVADNPDQIEVAIELLAARVLQCMRFVSLWADAASKVGGQSVTLGPGQDQYLSEGFRRTVSVIWNPYCAMLSNPYGMPKGTRQPSGLRWPEGSFKLTWELPRSLDLMEEIGKAKGRQGSFEDMKERVQKSIKR